MEQNQIKNILANNKCLQVKSSLLHLTDHVFCTSSHFLNFDNHIKTINFLLYFGLLSFIITPFTYFALYFHLLYYYFFNILSAFSFKFYILLLIFITLSSFYDVFLFLNIFSFQSFCCFSCFALEIQ